MMLVPPATFGARGTSLINTLSNLSLTTNLQYCYDAGDANSYPGSGQTWLDLSSSALNATNGISSGNTTNDWAFNGTAGRESSGEFWRSVSSVFRISLQSWMQALHKDGAKVAIAGWARSDTSYSGFSVTTYDSPGVIGGTAFPGFGFGISNGGSTTLGAPVIDVRRSDGNAALLVSGTNVVPSGWAFTAVSLDEGASTIIFQVNANQETVTASYSSPSSSDATRDMLINRSAPSGTTDLAMVAMWTTTQSSADLLALYNATKGRFGL